MNDKKKYIIALDQGTTSSRTILFNGEGRPLEQVSREFRQIYPRPGWVEHDPLEIWESQLWTLKEVLARSNKPVDEIAAIGITNQRETTLVWERDSGKPVYNAIVWQCRRTAPVCEDLKEKGLEEKIREKTGLVLDAYFSGTKVKWILDNVSGAREKARKGELCFGTVDSWLIYKLTAGKVHATDYSNASRTLLYNIREKCWDNEILSALDIPESMLPEVKSSSGHLGTVNKDLIGCGIPLAGVAGDQQAALFGQGCFDRGLAKNTYGTGCFLLMNTGEEYLASKEGLLTTLAWGVDGKVEYALEGSIFIAGAAIQWLRDEMKLIEDAAGSEEIAMSIENSGGVYFVPAFAGLGAPYWDMYARGTIVGLTRGTGRAHMVRAALESIAFQVRALIGAMEADSGLKLKELRVDGGAVVNSFLMQFQADILGVPVVVSKVTETTALGAAYLAGLAVGFWESMDQISSHWQEGARYVPAMDKGEADCLYAGWKRAVERAKGWDRGHLE
ncbi:MAG: glycerol kinase GlpK [Deltaproteobacteria bacterium]|nr:glycerol kinase GlpK [Deltaproteobacteria bacterium]